MNSSRLLLQGSCTAAYTGVKGEAEAGVAAGAGVKAGTVERAGTVAAQHQAQALVMEVICDC